MPRPFCSVDFATLGERPTPVRAKIIRAGGFHEIAIIRFTDRNLSSKNYRTDLPIRVRWGLQASHREEFVGYVHHIESDVEREKDRPEMPVIEVTAIGPTRALRSEEPRNWGATRSDFVVRELTRSRRLGYDVDISPIAREALMQPAESSWAFLRKLAEEEGFFLSAQGTRVLFWDMDKRLPKMRPHAPVFTRSAGTVQRFQPVVGELDAQEEGGAAERTAFSLSEDGKVSAYSDRFTPIGRSLSSSWEPPARFRQTRSGVVLDSANEARDHLASVGRKSGRIYRATANLAPHPALRPGDPVVLLGYGERHSGYWIADRVEFDLTGEGLTSKVSLSRSLVKDDGRRPRVPGTRMPGRPRIRPLLVNNVWVDRSGQGR